MNVKDPANVRQLTIKALIKTMLLIINPEKRDASFKESFAASLRVAEESLSQVSLQEIRHCSVNTPAILDLAKRVTFVRNSKRRYSVASFTHRADNTI